MCFFSSFVEKSLHQNLSEWFPQCMAQIQPYCVTQLCSSVAGIQQSEVGGKSENEMTEV